MLSNVVHQPNLDSTSNIPLYRQLYEHFSGLIQSGNRGYACTILAP